MKLDRCCRTTIVMIAAGLAAMIATLVAAVVAAGFVLRVAFSKMLRQSFASAT